MPFEQDSVDKEMAISPASSTRQLAQLFCFIPKLA